MAGQTFDFPDPSPAPNLGAKDCSSDDLELVPPQSLDQQIASAREELAAMKQLLDELPGIFENRFTLRMDPLLAHRERLRGDIQQLGQDLLHLEAERKPRSQGSLPSGPQGQSRLSGALRHAFSLGRSS